MIEHVHERVREVTDIGPATGSAQADSSRAVHEPECDVATDALISVVSEAGRGTASRAFPTLNAGSSMWFFITDA